MDLKTFIVIHNKNKLCKLFWPEKNLKDIDSDHNNTLISLCTFSDFVKILNLTIHVENKSTISTLKELIEWKCKSFGKKSAQLYPQGMSSVHGCGFS